MKKQGPETVFLRVGYGFFTQGWHIWKSCVNMAASKATYLRVGDEFFTQE